MPGLGGYGLEQMTRDEPKETPSRKPVGAYQEILKDLFTTFIGLSPLVLFCFSSVLIPSSELKNGQLRKLVQHISVLTWPIFIV